LRGLRKSDWVCDGVVQTQAFVPDAQTSSKRSDSGRETSINWEDDGTVEQFTLSNNNAQHGAARIQTSDIQETSAKTKMVKDPLFYERKIIPGNDYHGNIVFRSELKGHTVKMLAAALAIKSEFVPRR
jgi:hypothetical protein